MVLIFGCLLCACEERKSESGKAIAENTQRAKDGKQRAREQWEKGYDLPLEEEEQAEAATECKKIMDKIQSIYKLADKTAVEVVLEDETMLEMQKAVSLF